MRRVDVPVLIVGAGPVGLTAAILLAQQGIHHRIIERRDGPHRAPQAHVVNSRTLEICRAAGLDMEKLRERATPREDGSQVVWTTTLAGEELGRLPYERQGDENLRYTPTPLLNLSQHLFEPILADRLREERTVGLHYRHQWTALEQDAHGVTAQVLDLDADETYEVRSRYLLAADGAGSRVRTSLGIDMVGPERIQSFIMIHFEANLRELVRDRPAILYWTLDPDATGSFVAHDIEHTWVFMHPYDAAAESAEAYTESFCEKIVRRAIGKDDVALSVRDVSTWSMTAQLADRYAAGRVYLIGDSAHRFPPTGGMGMNTGIQDAHNLVWKLCAVEKNWAPAALLDTYEVERRPVAQNNADQSLTNALKILEVFEALGLSDDRVASRVRLAESLSDPRALERLGHAIDNQQEHFDMFGLQLGFSYEAGAVVPDETEMPANARPVRDFVPTSRPGSRVPHAWVEADGRRLSTLDLLPYDRFTLVTGADGRRWEQALSNLGTVPIQCLVAGRDFTDPDGDWRAVCGIGPDGALLVRPDQHVAWRSQGAAADPAKDLAAAFHRVLGSRRSSSAPQAAAD